MSPVNSSRWCPTPEQLMILEELYRNGIRTPNASQIQRITAHLSLYGKIEGKNVFYWFQNHKARDRQKLRRKLIKQLQLQQQQQQQQQQQVLYYHHHQLHRTTTQSATHNLLNYFDPPVSSPPAFHELPYHPSIALLPHQHGEVESNAPTEMMNYTWKVEIPQRDDQMENSSSLMRMFGHDLIMMMDVGPLSPSSTRPLKTLELFPVTASSNPKEDCNNPQQHQLTYSSGV